MRYIEHPNSIANYVRRNEPAENYTFSNNLDTDIYNTEYTPTEKSDTKNNQNTPAEIPIMFKPFYVMGGIILGLISIIGLLTDLFTGENLSSAFNIFEYNCAGYMWSRILTCIIGTFLIILIIVFLIN